MPRLPIIDEIRRDKLLAAIAAACVAATAAWVTLLGVAIF